MFLCKTGMKAVFHAGEARVTIVRFGRQNANLLAWGDSSGCVCIASLQEPGQLMHVRLATPTSTVRPVKAYKPMHFRVNLCCQLHSFIDAAALNMLSVICSHVCACRLNVMACNPNFLESLQNLLGRSMTQMLAFPLHSLSMAG